MSGLIMFVEDALSNALNTVIIVYRRSTGHYELCPGMRCVKIKIISSISKKDIVW